MTVERDLLLRLAAGPVSEAAPARETGQIRPTDWLDAEAIRAALPGPVRAGLAGLEVAWSLDSTNSELLRRSTPLRGADALLAERQTGGRGRRGRAWASPLGAHVYLSLARQFRGGLARLGGLSLVAGTAAAEALRSLGFENVWLKWPNDLVVVSPSGFRKLGGLLVEGGGEQGDAVRAVVGLGVNVRMPETFAAGIDQPWIDLQALADAPPSRNCVAAALIAALLPAFDRFDAEGLAPFLPRYAALDALAGRGIDVHEGVRTRRGTALGIAEDGALRVEVDGTEQRLYAGDVSVRPQ